MAAIQIDEDSSPIVGGTPTTTLHPASAAASNGSSEYKATLAKSGNLGPDFFPSGINLDTCPNYNNIFGLVVPGRPVLLDFRCVVCWSEAVIELHLEFFSQNDNSAALYHDGFNTIISEPNFVIFAPLTGSASQPRRWVSMAGAAAANLCTLI